MDLWDIGDCVSFLCNLWISVFFFIAYCSYFIASNAPSFALVHACIHAKSLQSCPILCNAMDCSPPGSSVHGIPQTRIQDWVAISFSMGSSQARDQTCISCLGRQILYYWAPWEAHLLCLPWAKMKWSHVTSNMKEAYRSGKQGFTEQWK